jgi:hypothetical protein
MNVCITIIHVTITTRGETRRPRFTPLSLSLCSNYLHPVMAVQSKQALPKELTPLGYALAGALGGCFSNA